MSLQLDERRLAMLDAMGIKLFQPALTDAVAPPLMPPSLVHMPQPGQAATAKPSQARPEIELLAWDALAQAVASCRACKLCEGRTNTVFGVGDRQADWLIVGEAPGEHEDRRGEPFVGQAGKLLDNMLKALGLDRDSKVYIANVLKCRPPGNRNPQPEEVAQCEPFLRRQVQLLQPKIILAVGRFAVQSLLGTTEAIGKLRGRVHQYSGVPVVVTYHPAYLLRNLQDKAKAWADLCFAQELLRQNSR
jgi:uracil-DNA glycosylase